MRLDALRIESVGSWWFLDEAAHEYLRMPKTEGPRSSPPGQDWGGPDAGSLEDLRWHPYQSWHVEGFASTGRRLVIDGYDGGRVSAPLPHDSPLGD